jgi:hypothetical protein
MLEVRKNILRYAFFAFVSLLFGIVLSVALNLYHFGVVKIDGLCSIFGLSAFVVLVFVYYIISKDRKADISEYNVKKLYMIHLIIAVVVNMLAFLAYYPGVGMNDGLNILNHGMEISNQFPVFYVLFIDVLAKIGYAIGNLRIIIALYTFIQFVLMSVLIAGVCAWFWSRCIPRWTKYIISTYFLFEPLIIMYNISMLKDTLFSMLLLIVALCIYEACCNENIIESKKFRFVFYSSCLGVIVTRNNGYYIILPCLAIMIFIICHKKYILMALVLTIFTILISSLATKYFGGGHLFQETVGVPLQQMAAVVANSGDMSADEAEFIDNILPLNQISGAYNPYSVDAIKWQSGFNNVFLSNHKLEFFKIYFSLLCKNFNIYVKAYLQQTFWFWAPIQNGTVQCFFSIENTGGNMGLPEFMEKYGIYDKCLLPKIIEKPIKFYLGLGEKFMQEGVCFWIMLFSLVIYIFKTKNKKKCLCYLPAVLLWLTIMVATPVSSSFRYVLIFLYAMPLFLALLLERDGSIKLQKTNG